MLKKRFLISNEKDLLFKTYRIYIYMLQLREENHFIDNIFESLINF